MGLDRDRSGIAGEVEILDARLDMPRIKLLVMLLLSLGAAAPIAQPPAAQAWRYDFQGFLGTKNGTVVSWHADARKCSGGMLGTYKFRSVVTAGAGKQDYLIEVRADLPVTRQWRRVRDVDIEIEAPKDFPPEIVTEIIDAYGEFYESTFVRWRPEQLTFRTNGLTVFGAEILPPGEHEEKFKPKPGC